GSREGLEAGLDQRRHAAAQHGLLAEQVGLGLLAERGLENAGARAAERRRVRQRERVGAAARRGVHREQRGRAAALLVGLAHAVTGRLGRDQRDVDPRGRRDRAVVDVEAVREQERLSVALAATLAELRTDAVAPDRRLRGVGREHHQHVAPRGDLAARPDGQPGALRGRDPLRARREADAHVDAGVAQVERVGVALRAVADDGYLLVLDQTGVGIAVIEDSGHHAAPCDSCDSMSWGACASGGGSAVSRGSGICGRSPRAIATTPVRTISMTPSAASTPTRSSILSWVAVSSTVTICAVRSTTRAPNTSQTWSTRGR